MAFANPHSLASKALYRLCVCGERCRIVLFWQNLNQWMCEKPSLWHKILLSYLPRLLDRHRRHHYRLMHENSSCIQESARLLMAEKFSQSPMLATGPDETQDPGFSWHKMCEVSWTNLIQCQRKPLVTWSMFLPPRNFKLGLLSNCCAPLWLRQHDSHNINTADCVLTYGNVNTNSVRCPSYKQRKMQCCTIKEDMLLVSAWALLFPAARILFRLISCLCFTLFSVYMPILH